jgi:hypothetical protein
MRLREQKGFDRFGLFVQDYGGPVGFRIVTRKAAWLDWSIIQNTNHPEYKRVRGRIHKCLGFSLAPFASTTNLKRATNAVQGGSASQPVSMSQSLT